MKALAWIVLAAALLSASPAAAQTGGADFDLRLNRNVGFGGFGKIQGRFTLEARNLPDQVKAVSFFVDGQLLGRAEGPPFDHRFHTEQLAPGRHTFRASAQLAEGQVLLSDQISREVLTADQAWESISRMLGPLLLAVGLFVLLGAAVPLLLGGREHFEPGRYGAAGGAICRRCRLPFSHRWLSPNLVVGKLVRCPHCGTWAVRPRASRAELDRAEARFRKRAAGGSQREASARDFQRKLEDSRYQD